jgi:hypothetical protein
MLGGVKSMAVRTTPSTRAGGTLPLLPAGERPSGVPSRRVRPRGPTKDGATEKGVARNDATISMAARHVVVPSRRTGS